MNNNSYLRRSISFYVKMKKNNAMMKLAGIIGIICATVFVSCTKEEAGTPETKEKGREATITIAPPEGGMATRVVTSDDGTHLKIDGWKLGDELNLYKTTRTPEGWIDSLYPAITFTCIDAQKGTFSGLLPEWVASVDELDIATTGTAVKYNGSSTTISFYPKATASTNVEDVILLANVRSKANPFQMQALGSILKVKNKTHKDYECAMKWDIDGTGDYKYILQDLTYSLAEQQYSGFATPQSFSDAKFTIAKDTSTFIYILGSETGKGICIESDDILTATCSVVPIKKNVQDGKFYSYTPVVYSEGGYEGFGIKIDDVIWAPVNCGYDADHLCGKLYQWGRMDGSGYYNSNSTTPPSDAKDKVIQTNPVNLGGNYSNYYNPNPDAASFYYNPNFTTTRDWYTSSRDTLLDVWPLASPYGTSRIGNPCPAGWRVPTSDEIGNLVYSNWDPSKQTGTKIRHRSIPSEGYCAINGLSFPIAGNLGSDGNSGPDYTKRGEFGKYWSSTTSDRSARNLTIQAPKTTRMESGNRANGYSVRCVKYVSQDIFDGGTIKDMDKTDLDVLDW